MAIERRHSDTYQELFVHRRDIYAQQTKAGAYFRKSAPVIEHVVRGHLMGNITAGWYALAEDSTVRWVCLDADRDDGLEQLQAASRVLAQRKISSQVLELSRRGGHLWVFFEPITARVARQLILGAVPELDGVEVFPKQDFLAPKTPVGSLVRGPLGIHRLTGKHYPFVDPEGQQPVSRTVAGTLEYLAEVRPLSAGQVA
jgi:hypothetical protein